MANQAFSQPLFVKTQESAFPAGIAICGAAGRLGCLAVRRLHRTDSVTAIDPRSFENRPADVEHLHAELVRKETRNLFRRRKVGAVVYLGPHYGETMEVNDDEWIPRAIEGFSRLLEYCDRYDVRKVVVMSSADIYGARAHNPQFLTEEAPLLATGLAALRDIDMMAQSFFWKRPDIETVILRPAHLVGAVAGIMARYLRMSPVPRLLGYDPMIQLLHEEDAIQAVRLALCPGKRGIFNLAGPDPIPLSRIVERLGRSTISVPYVMAKPLLAQLRLVGRGADLAGHVEYIRYVCMVDDTRARQILGYSPIHGIESTLAGVDLWT
jgi:UDP-glucose 4-epimerase